MTYSNYSKELMQVVYDIVNKKISARKAAGKYRIHRSLTIEKIKQLKDSTADLLLGHQPGRQTVLTEKQEEVIGGTDIGIPNDPA